MGFFISEEFRVASEKIAEVMQIIIVIAIPLVIIGILLLLSPFFCCCCAFGDKMRELHKRVIGVAKHIFCFLEVDDIRFAIYGYRAPTCYTYYLLFMTFILCLHCFLNFWNTAIQDSYTIRVLNQNPYFKQLYCIDIFNVTGVQIDKNYWSVVDKDVRDLVTVNYTCIEINFTKGVEDAGVTFGFSAASVAIVTWFLLTCTKGDRVTKCRSPILYNITACLIVIIIQIAGLFGPRILLTFYLDRVTRNAYEEREIHDPYPAITNTDSLYSIIAIFDAISLSMLTPWMNFEKINKKGSYDVSNPV